MKDTICRAITFINYNIPIRKGSNIWTGFAEYYTTGFFDRMYTKRVDCNYASKQLRGLWDYNIDCIAKGDGTYAHQNVYCFSKDEWNEGITDEEFWDYEKYAEMLLTFVIFVQTNGYVQEENGLEKRCKKFNDAVCEQLQDNGYVYTYVTVDKNDFVICIRSKKYKEAVNAIMKLHETDCEVVYSYSIFGISRNRQEQISEMEYKELNSQQIDSISLKGVTNSTKIPNEESYTLDAKYVGFCKQLVEKLYEDRNCPFLSKGIADYPEDSPHFCTATQVQPHVGKQSVQYLALFFLPCIKGINPFPWQEKFQTDTIKTFDIFLCKYCLHTESLLVL